MTNQSKSIQSAKEILSSALSKTKVIDMSGQCARDILNAMELYHQTECAKVKGLPTEEEVKRNSRIDSGLWMLRKATLILASKDAEIDGLRKENEELKSLAHVGLPNECIIGETEVKFCHHRQGEGNKCIHCSNYK